MLNVRTRAEKIYFNYKNKTYAIPNKVIEKYVVAATSIPSEQIFSDIEKKFTKPGVLLKGLRGREGLTQAKFAKKIHVTQANLSNMERGKRSIGKQIAKRIDKVFKVNYRYFLN